MSRAARKPEPGAAPSPPAKVVETNWPFADVLPDRKSVTTAGDAPRRARAGAARGRIHAYIAMRERRSRSPAAEGGGSAAADRARYEHRLTTSTVIWPSWTRPGTGTGQRSWSSLPSRATVVPSFGLPFHRRPASHVRVFIYNEASPRVESRTWTWEHFFYRGTEEKPSRSSRRSFNATIAGAVDLNWRHCGVVGQN